MLIVCQKLSCRIWDGAHCVESLFSHYLQPSVRQRPLAPDRDSGRL